MAKQYILWPGAQSFPGSQTFPNSYGKVDDGVTEVESKKGSKWELVDDPDGLAVAANAHIGSSEKVAAQANFPITLDRIAPSATLAHADTAVVREIWSRVVNAEEGVFLKIKSPLIDANSITSDKLAVGALDGQVITGAQIQTAHEGGRIILDKYSLRLISPTGDTMLDARTDGEIKISGRIGRHDTWSECYFNDLVDGTTNTDVSTSGYQYGVGLAWTSSRFAQTGSLTCGYDSATNVGSLVLTSPAVSATANRPQIFISEKEFRLTSSASRISLDASTVVVRNGSSVLSMFGDRMSISGVGASGGFSFNLNSVGFAINTGSGNNGPQAYANAAGFSIGMGSGKANVGGTSTGGIIAGVSSSRYIQVEPGTGNVTLRVKGSGIAADGNVWGANKYFLMPVPGYTKNEHDDYLYHTCTESPWPGIEYWDVITLDENGEGVYECPDYFTAIYHADKPLAVLATGQNAPCSATHGLEGSVYRVHVKGGPGDSASVLVKAARHVWNFDDEGNFVDATQEHGPNGPWMENLFLPPPPAPDPE